MPEEHKKLRAYILSEIGEKERQEIEERLMTDEDFFRELSLVEETVIQEYADGQLTTAERAKFERCFLVSEENRQKLRFARALRKYVNETESPKPQPQKKPTFFDSLKTFFLSPVPVTLTVLIVLSVGGFWIWKSFSADRSESLIALNEAYKTERPLESRITDLDYAPTKNTRGVDDDNKTDKIKLALARETALRAVSENPSAENLHVLGRVYLAEKKFNDAIEQFDKAVKLAPGDAKLRNDLGAAFLEKTRTMEDGKLETLAKANEEFAKAIDLNKNLTDAYFNQALTIQSLNLLNQAREAWQKYLELDSTSPWAEEARKNLESLETNKPISRTKEQILQEFLEAKQTGDHEKAWQTLSRNREMITGKLIPQQLAFLFIDAKAEGNVPKAEEYLDALVFVGNLETEKSGDLYWKHIADYYSTAAEKTIILKQAQDAVRKGYESCLANRYEQSEIEFQKAADLFAKSKNNWEEHFALYWAGYLLFLNNKVTASNQLLDRVVNFSQTGNYKWLLSQAFGWLAVNAASANKFSKSIEYDKIAVKYSEEVSESYNLQKILSQTAEHYQQVGQFTKALSYAQRGLEIGIHPEASLRQKWRDYDGVSDLFKVMKFYKTSELYQKENLRLALEELDDDIFKWMTFTGLASIYAVQNKYDEAFELLNDSLKVIKDFENADGQRKRSAYIHLQKAHLYLLEKKYSEALANYDIAVNFYASSEYRVNEYEARKGKLMCYIAENNNPAFQQELPIVLDIFNKNRSDILEEQNRNSFFDNEQSIYDVAIDFESRKNDFEKAFNYSEESRARSLLDLQNSFVEVSSDDNLPEIKLSPNVFQPLKLRQIQAEMNEKVQLLEYSVLKDKILIWVINKNGFSLTKSKIAAEDLEKKVSRYSEVISKNVESGEQQNLSAELYKILINPVKDKLDAGKEICIIPDKNLFLLPFATLKEEKYFIEDYFFFYAPSANVFLTSSKKANNLGAEKFENLLSIGNPSFDPNAFENLSDLSSAAREAIEVAGFYDKSLIFTEKTATKKNFKDAVGKADVIHFAGHYVVNEHSPLLSSFVLAGNNKDDSGLANYEIITEKLKARLIILSACQTGVEKYYNGEGMIGAARTFLAMGVPLTVASQWQVDSDATAKLMTDFHRYRKIEGLSTVAALRKSQIEMLRSEKFQQPYFWAAFTALGGYSKI